VTRFFRLPATILESMCGGGDHAERDLLRAAHVSRRMAQLRAILDTVDERTAGQAALAENFQALAEIQRHDPDAVADLLAGPQVGAWAALCLRALSHGAGSSPGRTPLRTHLAQLGAVAASAALRAEVRVRVVVPVRSGAAHFPALGRALTGGHDGLAECVTDRSGVLLDGARPVAWQPVRHFQVEAGGVSLAVRIDDLDPYWRAFGLPIARLSDDEVAGWRTHVEQAWRVLARRHAHRLDTMAEAVRCLVPVEKAGRLGGVSASSADAPGAIALTEPSSPARLAATLVHESQHYRLATLHDLRPVFTESSRRLHYSPWRNDPRPLSGVVHGLVAFTGVADFWSRERDSPSTELEYARYVRQLRVAHRLAAGDPDLTPFGATLVDALGVAIDALPVETGPHHVRRIADDLVAEHRARWRLANVTHDETTVRAAADALAHDRPLPEALGRPTRTDPGGDNPLARIAMAWLDDEAEVRALAEDRELFARRFPAATPADLRLLADATEARADALAGIASGDADHRTWALLAVVHGRACADQGQSPLVRTPELVMAAFTRLGTDDVRPLVDLMARYEAGTSMSDSIRR
jgi:HEXXH motif-containing protein